MINIDINNQILQIVTACVLLLLIIYFIYICLKDHKSDKEDRAEILDIMSEMEEKKQKIEKVEKKENQKPVVVEEIEEVKEVEAVETKSEIEEMLEKMQHDLEAKSEDVVENFEKEQEEKSIISYQELLKSLNKETNPVKIENTKIEVETPKEESVLETNIEPVVDEMDLMEMDFRDTVSHSIPEIVEPITEKVEPVKETKKFKNTDFISPIYGKMEEHLDYPKVPSFRPKEQIEFDFESTIQNNMVEETIEEIDRKLESHNIDDYLEDFDFHGHMKIDSLEQTLDMPPISPEIKANEDFLQALKEFRKNLE